MKSKATKLLALLGLASLAVTACSAGTVTFVDTITGSNAYQVGSQVVRGSEVGFASYPASGNFTSVRTRFAVDTAGNAVSVCSAGTSGGPISAVGAWVAQPFTPAQSGNITSVSLIAQNMHSVAPGYETEVADTSRSMKAFIVPADSAGNCTVTGVPAVTFSIPYSAGIGTIVSSTNSASASVTAGQKYFLVVGVGTPTQSWSGGSQYARLNWELLGQNIDSCGATVGAAQQNHNNANSNASGLFVTVPGVVIGLALTGNSQTVTQGTAGSVQHMGDNLPVSMADVVITATTGAVAPDFYVEDPLRPAGIRVKGTAGYSVGQHVTITGSTTTVLPNGEKEVVLDTIAANGGVSVLGPLFANIRAIKGATNTVGLLMRAAGMVLSVGSGSFVLTDGSDSDGITVIGSTTWSQMPTSAGGHAIVTGEVSLDASGSRVLLVRSGSDIQ